MARPARIAVVDDDLEIVRVLRMEPAPKLLVVSPVRHGVPKV